MFIIDAHCDTLTELIIRNENLYNNSCHINIKKLLSNKFNHNYNHIQFFAAFCGENPAEGEMNIRNQIIQFKIEISTYNKLINQCKSSSEVIKSIEQGKIAALLSVEGLNFISNSELIEENLFLKYLIKSGVKMVGLSWNYSGNICSSCMDENDNGLSEYGRELIKYLNKNHIIIDVSHMSDKSTDDTIAISTKPIVASHSNCKSICNHARNLSDVRIKLIANNNGIICVNFYKKFLKISKSLNSPTVGIDYIIRHIEHIASLVGIDYIGIGTDFDGILYPAYNMTDCTFLYKLVDKLYKLNYNEFYIEKIMGKNFLRVMRLNE